MLQVSWLSELHGIAVEGGCKGKVTMLGGLIP